MFAAKRTSHYVTALVYFCLSGLGFVAGNTMSTGFYSLWSLAWLIVTVVLAMLTANFIALLVAGRNKQVEQGQRFGTLMVSKSLYYTASIVYAGFQSVRHLIGNTATSGASSVVHLVMLLLGLAVIAFSVDGLHTTLNRREHH